jgi:hypothetical protein
MNLFRRHIGRRVVGVGVGVALLVLGLEAPAFAAPVISGISPTSGPVGCVVVITGTGFDQAGAFAIADVSFTGAVIGDTPADFHVMSDTEIWTTVPAGAATGAIRVSDGNTPANTADSGVFTVTTDAGGCTPTITSFEPTCGVVGTVVTITGTNLLSDSGDDGPPVVDPTGGDVLFNPYVTPAAHTGAAESPTTLVVNVPASAVDGPIRVDTSLTVGDDNVDSAESFNVAATATECVPPVFARSITLKLVKKLVAKGKVSAADATAPAGCTAGVPVKIQRKRAGGWRTVGKTTTSDTGAYKKRIKNRRGKYRSLAPKVTLATGEVCSRARSRVVRH